MKPTQHSIPTNFECLSILVGILNTGKTFPFGLCFITSETTASFEFMEQQLDDPFFYNCPRLKVIYGDFAKGLASAIAKREAQYHADRNPSQYILQLCEWHEVEAIKRHLVAAGRYPKDIRDNIIDLIWKWVKSSSQIKLEVNRTELLQSLLPKEQEYLLLYYQPKEHQFVRAYTHSILSKFGRQFYSAQRILSSCDKKLGRSSNASSRICTPDQRSHQTDRCPV